MFFSLEKRHSCGHTSRTFAASHVSKCVLVQQTSQVVFAAMSRSTILYIPFVVKYKYSLLNELYALKMVTVAKHWQ